MRCYRKAIHVSGVSSGVWLEYVRRAQKIRMDFTRLRGKLRIAREVAGSDEATQDLIFAQAWEIAGRPDRASDSYRQAARKDPKHVAALGDSSGPSW